MKHVLDFGPKSEATLKHLADTLDLSKEDTIIRALAILSGVVEEAERGNEMVFRAPDGTIKTLEEAA
jgi:hypothetical protein